jgi:hypothetical protein
MRTQTSSGSHGGSRSAKLYRGSRQRLQRIKLRRNGSWELWLLVAWVLFLLFVVVPWMLSTGKR